MEQAVEKEIDELRTRQETRSMENSFIINRFIKILYSKRNSYVYRA